MNDRDKLQKAELRILELEAEIRRRDEGHVCPRIPNPGEYAIELVKALEMHAFPPRWVTVPQDLLEESKPDIMSMLRGPLRVVPVADDADMYEMVTGIRPGTSAAYMEQYEKPVREKVERKQREFASSIGTAIHEIMLSMPPLLKDGDIVMLTYPDGETSTCVVDATAGDGQSGSLLHIDDTDKGA